MNFNYLGLKKLIETSYAGSPIVCQQLSFFSDNKTTASKPIKQPYKVELASVKDENNDGAVDLNDIKLFVDETTEQ